MPVIATTWLNISIEVSLFPSLASLPIDQYSIHLSFIWADRGSWSKYLCDGNWLHNVGLLRAEISVSPITGLAVAGNAVSNEKTYYQAAGLQDG